MKFIGLVNTTMVIGLIAVGFILGAKYDQTHGTTEWLYIGMLLGALISVPVVKSGYFDD